MIETIYYVDPVNGNDLNSGLSPELACRTLSKFFGPPLDAGEVHAEKSPLSYTGNYSRILLKRGTVFPEIPNINRSGQSPAETLTIGAYGTGVRPRIFGISAQAGAGINYVTIENLEFRNDVKYQNVGVSWKAAGTNNTIRNCRFSGLTLAWAIETPDGLTHDSIKNFLIEDCKAWDTKTIGVGHSQGGYLQGHENLIIRNCVLDHVGKVNDQFDQGLYCHGTNKSIKIENCIVSTDGCVGIQCRGGHFDVINNLVMKCAYGITFGSGTNKKQCAGNVKRNVVLYGRDMGADPIACGIGISMNADDTEVSENIVAHKKGSSAPSNFGGLCYGNTEAFIYTSLINPNVNQRKSGEVSMHDNFVVDWAPALVLSEHSNGGFTANYYLVRTDETMLKFVNSRQWSVDALDRQFLLPEDMANMSAMNTWWSPQGRWSIRLEGWDHQPRSIPQDKIGIMDQGATSAPDTFTSMPDITVEKYLRDFVGLPSSEQTYERFMAEALKEDSASWATASAFNSWARSQVGL